MRDSNLQLFIIGGDFKWADSDVLLTIRACSDPPPAILCLQSLVLSPLNQEEDQSSQKQPNQHLYEHGVQYLCCVEQRRTGERVR